ncbi:MAG: hypothetical protein AB7U34_05770 [Novosphingobium sp.]
MPSRPENGGWRGPERSDYTVAVFCPKGLGLDGKGAAGPKTEKAAKAAGRKSAATWSRLMTDLGSEYARGIVTVWPGRFQRPGARSA